MVVEEYDGNCRCCNAAKVVEIAVNRPLHAHETMEVDSQVVKIDYVSAIAVHWRRVKIGVWSAGERVILIVEDELVPYDPRNLLLPLNCPCCCILGPPPPIVRLHTCCPPLSSIFAAAAVRSRTSRALRCTAAPAPVPIPSGIANVPADRTKVHQLGDLVNTEQRTDENGDADRLCREGIDFDRDPDLLDRGSSRSLERKSAHFYHSGKGHTAVSTH